MKFDFAAAFVAWAIGGYACIKFLPYIFKEMQGLESFFYWRAKRNVPGVWGSETDEPWHDTAMDISSYKFKPTKKSNLYR